MCGKYKVTKIRRYEKSIYKMVFVHCLLLIVQKKTACCAISGRTSPFGQVKLFANFESQLKVCDSLYFGRTCFIINVHVIKVWIISFITSERTIPLPKNKSRISHAKTTLWPVFLSTANEVPIFGHIGCVMSPNSTFIRFVLKLA